MPDHNSTASPITVESIRYEPMTDQQRADVVNALARLIVRWQQAGEPAEQPTDL